MRFMIIALKTLVLSLWSFPDAYRRPLPILAFLVHSFSGRGSGRPTPIMRGSPTSITTSSTPVLINRVVPSLKKIADTGRKTRPREYQHPFRSSWQTKIYKILFRGSSTSIPPDNALFTRGFTNSDTGSPLQESYVSTQNCPRNDWNTSLTLDFVFLDDTAEELGVAKTVSSETIA